MNKYETNNFISKGVKIEFLVFFYPNKHDCSIKCWDF